MPIGTRSSLIPNREDFELPKAAIFVAASPVRRQKQEKGRDGKVESHKLNE
jgi:hypothetical protein